MRHSKSQSVDQQDEHHRGAALPSSLGAALPSSSEEEDLRSEPLRHYNRPEAEVDEIAKKPRICWPRPSDKIWAQLDKEIKTEVNMVFNRKVMSTMSPTELSARFDEWVYDFFAARFGVQVSEHQTKSARPPRAHAGLEKLRQRKKECRKVFKALKKAGLAESPEGLEVSRQWKLLVRKHNRLRVRLAAGKRQREQRAKQKEFRKDPNGFAQKLFKGSRSQAAPTFDKDTASNYFKKLYKDEGRDYEFTPLPGMRRPPPPTVEFVETCPNFGELMRSVKKKRNGAAAGFNGISYLPLKRCPSLISFMVRLGKRIWSTLCVPENWAQAYVTLIAKSENLDVPSEFRPIAVTSTVGKVFFSVISDRLQNYIVTNGYIDRKIQKGFLYGLPGCLEHSFALFEALREAKLHHRQIVISWIDLANAYGSVRHNLVQFALSWYHFPESIRKLLLDYYDKLMATVITENWSTGFFAFDIGLFQGCVLSTILFDLVFQLLLDFLDAKSTKKVGYSFKNADVSVRERAYADDLCMATDNVKDNQMLCNYTNEWLEWTRTMKAKPKKCVCMAMKLFDPRNKRLFEPIRETAYSPFDPKLTIAGEPMRFIFDPSNKDKSRFDCEHFKFLGRFVHWNLEDHLLKEKIHQDVARWLDQIEDSMLTGFMKVWLYQFYVIAFLSWPFLIHQFNLGKQSFKELSDKATARLKKWIGITKSADTGVLYRSKDFFGLGLTSIEDHFKRMQIIQCQLLSNSPCDDIITIYQAKVKREANGGCKWRATRLNAELEADVQLGLRFPSQSDRGGLGAGRYNAHPAKAAVRKLVSGKSLQLSQDAMVAHSHSLCRQSAWTRWADSAEPFDLSWRNLIYGESPHLIKFVIHSAINWVTTPDLLILWGKTEDQSCRLCGAKVCSIGHVLAGCKFALGDMRYGWRHDSVLNTLEPSLRQHLHIVNSKPYEKTTMPKLSESFVKAGTAAKPSATRLSFSAGCFAGARDWQLLADYDHRRITFPTEIYVTPLRPDIIIWSSSIKKVFLVELTVPLEENFGDATLRKSQRYNDLCNQINDTTIWKAAHFPFEVGARGFVARSTRSMLKKMGIANHVRSKIIKNLSSCSAKASVRIFAAHKSFAWDRTTKLCNATDDISKLCDASKLYNATDDTTEDDGKSGD